MAHLPLDPFTEEEARHYLARKGIADEQVAKVILYLSRRLPLLVATLATEIPNDPAKVGDPTGEAVERFLKWMEDPRQRQVALNAALPRQLNQDVLALLVTDEPADELFAWLRTMPFVEKRGDFWSYHDVVRGLMLRYKRQESPQGWANLHGRLARYYEDLRDGLGLEEEAGRKDEAWQGYALEVLYHQLCQSTQQYSPGALNGFLVALKAGHDFARRWAQTMEQAGKDVEVAEIQDWGKRLDEGLKAYNENRNQAAIEIFTALLETTDLEERLRPLALGERGYLYWLADEYSKALTDLSEAIRLAPNEAEYWADRGATYQWMGQYEDALADFSRAIELEPDNAWAIANRGEFYKETGQYKEALADFSRAIELQPDDVWATVSRGETYQKMEQHEEALADFSRAVELEPDNAWAIANRGEFYEEMGQYKEALTDFSRAIELQPDDIWAIVSRGEIYQEMEQHEEALADFSRAIELEPGNAWAIASRGETYRLMERYEEALADLSRATELEPDNAWIIAHRGATYRLMERYEEALADLNRAIELETNDAWAITERGETYRLMERYEEALADLNRTIELEPDNVWAIAARGETHLLMERYEEALADFNRAVELEPDNAWVIAHRGATYLLIERYEEALADLDWTMKLEPDNAWIIIGRGEIYQKMERYEEALADFNRAVQLEPDDAEAIASRGEIYRLMERYESALADFNRAIQLEPTDWRYYSRALVHLALNQHKEAQADLARAIHSAQQTHEENPQDWPNTLNLAPYHLATGETEEADRLYGEALSRSVSSYCIREALRNLDDFLALFPDHSHALAVHGRLQEHLQ